MANLLEVSTALPERSIAKGQTILEEGEKDGELLILRSGTVEIQKLGKVVTTIATPGAIFGELALLLDQGHTATAVALTDCEFYVMTGADETLRNHPELYREIAKTLARRLHRASDKTAELMTHLEFEQDLSDLEMTILWDAEV